MSQKRQPAGSHKGGQYAPSAVPKEVSSADISLGSVGHVPSQGIKSGKEVPVGRLGQNMWVPTDVWDRYKNAYFDLYGEHIEQHEYEFATDEGKILHQAREMQADWDGEDNENSTDMHPTIEEWQEAELEMVRNIRDNYFVRGR